jgi:hypothetical protein
MPATAWPGSKINSSFGSRGCSLASLERVGILTWVNRIVRIREWGPDLFGRAKNRWRVIRTSNAYTFADPGAGARARPPQPQPSKSELPTGTLSPFLNRNPAAAV